LSYQYDQQQWRHLKNDATDEFDDNEMIIYGTDFDYNNIFIKTNTFLRFGGVCCNDISVYLYK
jgi:hypothetical protein